MSIQFTVQGLRESQGSVLSNVSRSWLSPQYYLEMYGRKCSQIVWYLMISHHFHSVLTIVMVSECQYSIGIHWNPKLTTPSLQPASWGLENGPAVPNRTQYERRLAIGQWCSGLRAANVQRGKHHVMGAGVWRESDTLPCVGVYSC